MTKGRRGVRTEDDPTAFGVAEASRMPAFDDLLGAFAFSGTAEVARSSVEHLMTDLHIWRTINGAPWLRSEVLTLVGVGNRLPPFSACVPVTHKHLLIVLSALTL